MARSDKKAFDLARERGSKSTKPRFGVPQETLVLCSSGSTRSWCLSRSTILGAPQEASMCDVPNVKLMITYNGHWVDDTYKSGETLVRGVGTYLLFLGLMELVEDVVGVKSWNREIKLHELLSHATEVSHLVFRDNEDLASPLPFTNDIAMAMSDDDAFDQMHDECVEDGIVDWNGDDYVGKHDNYLKEDSGDNNDIPDFNHVDGDMISFKIVAIKEFRSTDDCLYRGKVFPSKAKLKRALNMLALREHLEIRVKKSCHACFEVACKDKACKLVVCATKLLDEDYWQVHMFHKFEKSLKDDIAPNGIIKSIKPRTSSNRNFKVKLRVSQFRDDSKW
ncbi:Uncharacterized protein TCM_003706 [Theobroma cacao]|uniref:Transposase MuDR plant domain-containing protein n=1 Tax=Theobroma cacao TaxID=3641 RepID=A0A061DNG4_THECC|nr:Uncharacterized protein TCM_003706 [Theobroma cacao]